MSPVALCAHAVPMKHETKLYSPQHPALGCVCVRVYTFTCSPFLVVMQQDFSTFLLPRELPDKTFEMQLLFHKILKRI